MKTKVIPDELSEEEIRDQSIANNPPVFETGDCRICFAPEDASGKGQIIQLGCQCKDDMSYGHESCLKEWFVRRLLNDEILNCELCRSSLGTQLEGIVRSEFPHQVMVPPQVAGVPQLLLLVRVPPTDLDVLEVPLETPDFSQLPGPTKLAIQDAFGRQEQVYRSGETRRGQKFREARLLAQGPLRSEDPPAWKFHWICLHLQFIVMEDVTRYRSGLLRDRPLPFGRAFLRNYEAQALYGDYDSIDPLSNYPNVILEGQVIRVAVEPELPAQAHKLNVEELLDDVLMHFDLLVAEYGEDAILLPSSMFVRDTEILRLAMDMDQQLNNAAARALGQQHKAAPACREFTYGRYQRFSLFDRI